jgi:hypothetical protein
MIIPTTEQLDKAALATSEASDEHDIALKAVIRSSTEVIKVYASILLSQLVDTDTKDFIDMPDADAKKLVDAAANKAMSPELQKERDSVKEALLAGIQIGLRAAESSQSGAPKLTLESMQAATLEFALEKLDSKGRNEFIDTYESLIDPVFIHMLKLAYGIASGDKELDNEKIGERLKSDVDLTRKMGVSLALGLMVGAKVRSTPNVEAASKAFKEAYRGKTKSDDDPIRGGWK